MQFQYLYLLVAAACILGVPQAFGQTGSGSSTTTGAVSTGSAGSSMGSATTVGAQGTFSPSGTAAGSSNALDGNGTVTTTGGMTANGSMNSNPTADRFGWTGGTTQMPGHGSVDNRGSMSAGPVSAGANSGSAVGLIRPDGSMPPGAALLGQGDILSIDRTSNTITMRDAHTGKILVRPVSDPQSLQSYKEGDSVQVFTQ